MTATDSSGASNAAASIDITINLQNVNEAPVANGDTVTIDEDTPITIDVLDKDSDPDANDTLTVLGTQRPTHGEAAVGPDNTITYTPDLHFDDSDSFTYRVTDMEGLFDEAEAGVIITMVNDTPEFVGSVRAQGCHRRRGRHGGGRPDRGHRPGRRPADVRSQRQGRDQRGLYT